MNVSNCRSCGRLFNVVSSTRLCPNCQLLLEEKFQEVKEYLRENPFANIDVLSRECHVSVKQLREWVKEERLVFAEGCVTGIQCEKCGVSIRTGRYCNACKTKVVNNLRGVVSNPVSDEKKRKEKERDRMRFLQNL